MIVRAKIYLPHKSLYRTYSATYTSFPSYLFPNVHLSRVIHITVSECRHRCREFIHITVVRCPRRPWCPRRCPLVGVLVGVRVVRGVLDVLGHCVIANAGSELDACSGRTRPAPRLAARAACTTSKHVISERHAVVARARIRPHRRHRHRATRPTRVFTCGVVSLLRPFRYFIALGG